MLSTFLFSLVLLRVNPGFDFLLLQGSPRDPGADEIGVEALLSNPAGLSLPGRGFYAYENFWLLDSRASFLGGQWKSYGFSLAYYDFGKIEFQGENPRDEEGPSFNPLAYRLSLARGVEIDPELSIGMGVSLYHQKIFRSSATNILVDVGARYTPTPLPWLHVGASLFHLGLKQKFREEEFKMPTLLLTSLGLERVGIRFRYSRSQVVTYNVPIGEISGKGIENRFLLAYSLPQNFEIFMTYAFGREIDPLALGLSYEFQGVAFSYSYRVPNRSFDAPHLVGLRFFAVSP